MDIFFQDPSEVPLPPDEVRIRELRANPWQDGRRVHVYLEVDPFQRRPSADLVITDGLGRVVAEASILETMVRKMEMNMHLRIPETRGSYTLHVTLFYSFPKQAPEGEEGGESPAGELQEPPEREVRVVDRAQASFSVEPESDQVE